MTDIGSISGSAAYQFDGLEATKNVDTKIEFSSGIDRFRAWFSAWFKNLFGINTSDIVGDKTITLTARQADQSTKGVFDNSKAQFKNNENQNPTLDTFTFTINSKYSNEDAQTIINLHTQAFSLCNKINSDPENASPEDINQLYNVRNELRNSNNSIG